VQEQREQNVLKILSLSLPSPQILLPSFLPMGASMSMNSLPISHHLPILLSMRALWHLLPISCAHGQPW